MVSTSVWDWAIIGIPIIAVTVAVVRLLHRGANAGPRVAPTIWSAFPLEATLGIVIGWLCAAVAVIGVPLPEQAAVLRSLVFVAGAILFGVPLVWRQRYLEARLRFAESEGLYQRLDDAKARDLHDTFVRLGAIQWALNGLTRDYHIRNHYLWIAEKQQQPGAANAIKAEMRELEGRMVLEYGAYEWEMLSVFRRLEQRGFTPDDALLKVMDRGCSTVADIDAISRGLHRMMEQVGPHAW